MTETEVLAEPGRQDIIIQRVFDAPREKVFQALTDPDLIPRWWGPQDFTTEVERLEVRPGGRWRMLHRDADGNEVGFRGVYHDVVAPETVVQTFEFEGAPGHVSLESLTLEEIDGRTRYRARAVHQSVEDRDAVLESGAEAGARETMERLDEVIRTL